MKITSFYFLLLVFVCRLSFGDTSFIAFGDFGTGDSEQQKGALAMENFCKSNACEYAIGVGDNFYPSGVTSVNDIKWKTHFADVYTNLGLVYYASLGNHDYGGNVQAQVEYSKKNNLWYMPSTYYRFTKDMVDFFVIDTNKFDSTQKQWLDSQLKKSTAKWKVVYGHHPIYSYGMHGNSSKLIKELLPMIRGRVDFYVAGHDHDRQLLVQPKPANEAAAPYMVVSGGISQNREVKKGPMSRFASFSPGFVQFNFSQNEAKVNFISEQGEIEYSEAFSPISRLN